MPDHPSRKRTLHLFHLMFRDNNQILDHIYQDCPATSYYVQMEYISCELCEL